MSPVTQMRRQGMSVGTDKEEKLLVMVSRSFAAKETHAAAARGRRARSVLIEVGRAQAARR
jgi:hypothetical protein